MIQNFLTDRTAWATDTEQILMMKVSTVTTKQSELGDTDVPSGEDSEFIDRPVTELVEAQAGSNTDFPNGEHSEFVDRPVTESVTVQTESNTNFASEEDSVFFGRPFTEPVTSRTGSDKDISGDVGSKLFDRPVTDSATAWAERDSHGPSDEYWKISGRPVTEAMTEMAGNDANISKDDYSDLFDQLVREWMTAGAESGEPQIGQFYGCRIPDCQCDGRIEIMEWGPEDMTETDDSDYEDSSVFDRPVTETAWAGSDTDLPSDEHQNFSADRSRTR